MNKLEEFLKMCEEDRLKSNLTEKAKTEKALNEIIRKCEMAKASNDDVEVVLAIKTPDSKIAVINYSTLDFTFSVAKCFLNKLMDVALRTGDTSIVTRLLDEQDED